SRPRVSPYPATAVSRCDLCGSRVGGGPAPVSQSRGRSRCADRTGPSAARASTRTCREWRPVARLLGAVLADDLVTVTVSPAGSVIDQETAGAGELVGLLRYHLHGELLAGEVRARQLEVVQDVGLVNIDRCRPLLGTTSVELFDRLGRLLVGLAATERVV